MWIKALAFLILKLISNFVTAQPYPPSLPGDTAKYGKNISRTMDLLHTSKQDCKKTVKILIYGQSISVQDWWLEVKRDLEDRFQNANLIIKNSAISGFSSQYLFKTVEADIASFYPDLVLLYDYGSNIYYDTLLSNIRSRTAAEIAIHTDHYTGENKWSDSMACYLLPALALKYHCDLWPLRDSWRQYTTDNNIIPKNLTTDGTHLNAQGNFLMAEILKPFFYYKPKYIPDSLGLLTRYEVGKDVDFKGDTLTLPFFGNRVDVVAGCRDYNPADSAKILIDGHRPSEFQGCYYASRPYSSKNKEWPWDLPGMIRIQHLVPWHNEEWSCIFTEAREPYSDFDFKIEGSETGHDGKGKGSANFVSPSKRVVILAGDAEEGGDWHLKRSYRVLKTLVKPGDTIKWKTYSICTDKFIPDFPDDNTIEKTTTLIQGISNTKHTLQMIRTGKNKPPVSEIRVYKPLWKRRDSMYLNVNLTEMEFKACADTSFFIVKSNDFWKVTGNCNWISANPPATSDDSWVRLTVLQNKTREPRIAELTVEGTGHISKTIHIRQSGNPR